jgi:predicted TIM-barrel fold metal-dependent hydrolase
VAAANGIRIDCDVHCAPASIDVLLEHMDDYWREYVAGGGVKLSPTLGGAYPPGARTSATPDARAHADPVPARVEALVERVLDPGNVRYVVLNCLSTFDTTRNPYFEAALARAVNDWLHSEWLERDDRLRASLVVPTLDADAAVAEIERLGDHPGFVQVLLPVRSDTPYGNVRYHRLYEAAARHDLVVGVHAWGRTGLSPTASGFSRYYLQDYLSNSQLLVQAHLMSLVAEGVFDRFPTLRVALLECGFSWLAPLLWRFDKDWKGVWREVPWVNRKPSAYVRRHVRATIEPAQLPADPAQVAEVAEILGARELLLYASDYPHDHGDGPRRLLDALDAGAREAILAGNAAELYGLET